MAFQLQDRVQETTTSTGTGALSLAGAMTGFRAFSSVCANADTFYYGLQAVTGAGVPSGNWEIGIGTYNASGNTQLADRISCRSREAAAYPPG